MAAPLPSFDTMPAQHQLHNGFEDFFNFDMLAASSSSRSSSRSPAHSPAFPPTPPQPSADLFSIGFFDDFAKEADPLALAAAIQAPAAPYDFFNALANYAPAATTSPSVATSATAVSPPLAIDPQLVDSPSPMAEHDDDDDEHDDEEEEDDSAPPSAHKVGGMGKQRKGTVQGGGIQKKARAVEKKEELDDNWRPSPEEYKKMSSKEKRQLRNKISARNFRNRRKEYINTLEGDIAERDRLIDAIRSELGSTKSENVALREEIDALKKALLEGPEGPILPPPAPLPEIPAALTATAAPAKPSMPLLSPNVNKDLSASSRAGSTRAFWAGNAPLGNYTPVHSMRVPDYSVFANTPAVQALSGKPADAHAAAPALQENMNPALNALPPSHGQTPLSGVHAFDAFADVNPFTLKTLDAYRMQLWGRMALAQQQQRKLQQQAQHAAPAAYTGLAAELRPAFFTASAKGNVSPATLAGKAASAAAAPLPGMLGARDAQTDLAAAMASQTLLGRLGGAFWDAFAGTDKRAGVDADKVRRVLEGTAVVRIVDVDEPAPPRPPPARMQSVSPKLSPRLAPTPAPAPLSCAAAGCVSVSDLLEESMRALTISKKSPPV